MWRRSIDFLLSRIFNWFDREGGLAELASGVSTTWWGAIMLFEQPDTSWRSVAVTQKFFDYHSLGVIGIVLGLGQVFAFRIIDKKWKWPVFRLGAAILLQCIWGLNLISACFLPGPIAPWSAPIFTMWFINFYLIVRFVGIARDGPSG